MFRGLVSVLLLILVVMSMIGLSGCVVSKSSYEVLESKLTKMESLYPPRDFKSYSELQAWASAHLEPVPMPDSVEKHFGIALRVQEEAAKEGFLVSANLAPEGDYYRVANTAVANGRLYCWSPVTGSWVEGGVTYRGGEVIEWPIGVYK